MSKWTDLKVRTISAIVLIAGFIFAMEIHPYAFFALLAIAYPIMLKEWFGLVLDRPRVWIFSIIGVVYITLGSAGLAFLHWVMGQLYDDLSAIYYIVSLVAASDIAGYAVGKTFGKHKLWPRISPNKTWEGLAGSLLFASCVSGLWILYYKGVEIYDWGDAWELAFAIAIIGTVPTLLSVAGDIFESYMKRRAGVKDSGNLIPGHGGLLDRVDGLLPPAIYFSAFLLIILLTLDFG